MAEKITPQQFHDSEGVEDWRVLWSVAFATFRTGDFATGLRLLNRIGELAEAVHHHPDVNLRYGVVEVRLVTHSHWALTDLDLALARQISSAARELGIVGDPGRTRTWEFALEALDLDRVRTGCGAVLGHELEGDTDIADPDGL